MNHSDKSPPDHDPPNASGPNPVMNARAYHRLLEGVSLVYFMSPFAIFVLGWLRPAIGLPLFVLLCAGAVVAFRRAASGATQDLEESGAIPSARDLAIMTVITLAVLACTGIGGFTFQFFDFVFYDAILKDLMSFSWPLAYAEAGPDGEPLNVVFYPAYWLPAALVGSLAGWYAAYMFHFLWAATGTLLILLWFLRIAQSRRIALVLMVLFFGGLDIAGRLLTESIGASNVSVFGYLAGEFWWSHGYGWLDHWSSNYALFDPEMSEKSGGVFYRFYSPLSFLVDGPHHLLPGVVGFMVLLHDWWRKDSLHRTWLLWATLPICSVFTAAGALPFALLATVEKRGRGLLSFPNIAAIPFVAIMYFYFASAQGIEGGRVSGWLWEFQDLSETWHFLLLHYIVEFGIYALVIPAILCAGRLPGRLWWLGALTMFLLSPFYRMGEYNDFTTKVIIPAQFVFLLYLAIAMLNAQGQTQQIKRTILIGLLCIGAIGPAGNLVRALAFGFTISPTPFERVRHVYELEPRVLSLQGAGDPDSVFFRWLADTPVWQPAKPIEATASWNFRDGQDWNPDKFVTFVDADQVSLTSEGLRIVTPANTPLLRRNDAVLDTRRIGKVRLKVEAFLDGNPVDDFSIIFLWATPEQVITAKGDWPFPKSQNNQAWPVIRVVAANSYWRETAQDVAFYFQVPGAGDEQYEVVLSEVIYLER